MHYRCVIIVRAVFVQQLPVTIHDVVAMAFDHFNFDLRLHGHVEESGRVSKVLFQIDNIRSQAAKHEAPITVEPGDRGKVEA